MRKMIAIILILFTVSCNVLKTGIIVDKEFTPKSTKMVMQAYKVGKITAFRPVLYTVPPRWEIKVEGIHGSKRIVKSISVTETYYLSVGVGDVFDIERMKGAHNED